MGAGAGAGAGLLGVPNEHKGIDNNSFDTLIAIDFEVNGMDGMSTTARNNGTEVANTIASESTLTAPTVRDKLYKL